ncbi:MAG: hypothetical protein Q9213_001371 [Squamulea squamosa]
MNPDYSYDLDIFGQQPMLKLYTQICLCFPLRDTISRTFVYKTLTQGLDRLHVTFPWLAGEVINEPSGEGNSGTFKITQSTKDIQRLLFKDLTDDPSKPTMSFLRESRFPMESLGESDIAPRKSLPKDPHESMPVFIVQATYIAGGLILTFVGQHQAMDMIGQSHLMSLLSKACRNEPFTDEDISSGNLSRREIIPLLGEPYTPGPELTPQIIKILSSESDPSDATKNPTPPTAPSCTWANITFSAESLTALKSLASQSLTLSAAYITTDDALSAFLWQRITLARRTRLAPSAATTLARAVDVRRYLGFPSTYPGVVLNMSYHPSPLQTLVSTPLGAIASELRQAIDSKTSTLGYSTRSLATYLSRTPDKTKISPTATADLSTDILLSSWAKLDCYDLDFGLGLGKPEAVRRPRFKAFESLIYLLPKRGDGEICVAVCLRDEDWEQLKEDEEFWTFAEYIG